MTRDNKIRLFSYSAVLLVTIFIFVIYSKVHNQNELSRIKASGNKFLTEVIAFKKQNGRLPGHYPSDNREIYYYLKSKQIDFDVYEWTYVKYEGESFSLSTGPDLFPDSGKPMISLKYNNGKMTDWIFERFKFIGHERTEQSLGPALITNE